MSNTDQAPEPSMEEILSSIRRIISDDSETPPSEEAAEVAEPEVAKEPEIEATPEVEAASEVEAVPEVEEAVEAEPEPDPDWGLEKPGAEAAEEVAEPDTSSEEDDDDIFELTNVVDAEENSEETPKETFAGEEPLDSVLDMADFDVTSEDEGVDIADSGADVEDDIEFVELDPKEPIMALPELGPEPVLVAEVPDDFIATDRLVSENTGGAAAASFGDLANTLLSRGDSATTVEELVQEMLRPLLKSWLDANLPTMVEKLVGEEIERIARRGR